MTSSVTNHTPLVLCILDGYGLGKKDQYDATFTAKTPFLDSLFQDYPLCKLDASGCSVGLSKGQMGNSEVGHMTIGSGRTIKQKLVEISDDIKSEVFENNTNLISAFEKVIKFKGTLHLFGLLGDGGIHAHQHHLTGILKSAGKFGIKKCIIHLFTDGRDTGTKTALNFTKKLITDIKKIGIGTIGTIGGRYYGMDRDKRWERLEKAYKSIIKQETNSIKNPLSYLKEQYEKNITDEFIEPAYTEDYQGIKTNDVLLFTNFRSDRMRQIVELFSSHRDDSSYEFNHFDTKNLPRNLYVFTMTEYKNTLEVDGILYPPQNITNTLSEVLSLNNFSQLHIAETEKYAHVTFFLNGGKEVKYKNEEWIVIPSPKIETYDEKPEMSAGEVTKILLEKIKNKDKDVYIVNFANPDMVGHTGNQKAVEKSLEYLDICIEKIVTEIKKQNGIFLLTADHGNCENMKQGDNQTTHTQNLVPFILLNNKNLSIKKNGTLADIAPTILELLGIKKPIDMTGESVLKV